MNAPDPSRDPARDQPAPQRPAHAPATPKPLMRSLGEFFGHVWKGVRTDPAPPRQVVRKDIQETTVETPQGPVTLRRTTVDEVELPRDAH